MNPTCDDMLSVKWEVHQQGWYKEKFDGASKGNPRVSGTEFVIKDWKGNILVMGAQKLS